MTNPIIILKPKREYAVYTDVQFTVYLQGDFGMAQGNYDLKFLIEFDQEGDQDNFVEYISGQLETKGGWLFKKEYYFKPDSQNNQMEPLEPAPTATSSSLTAASSPSILQFVAYFPQADGEMYTYSFSVNHNREDNWSGSLSMSASINGEPITSNGIPFKKQSWGLPWNDSRPVSQTNTNPDTMPIVQYRARATYPITSGNQVTFYNDASENKSGTAGAFCDLQKAIEEAQHFIFIVDWSFHPQLYLKRDQSPDDSKTLGQLLVDKAKAKENSNILIAIHAWKQLDTDPKNDKAGEYLAALNNGQRPANLLWRLTRRTGIAWSQHQKFVVLDAPINVKGEEKRVVKVFFGGLDLTQGRFDWPEHLIQEPEATDQANTFTPFKGFADWYNGEFAHNENLPREPWHDIHAQLIGSTAWDFVYEFVGRWNAGAGNALRGPFGDQDEDEKVWKKFQALMRQTPELFKPFHRLVIDETHHWSAQVYRSMERLAWTPSPNSHDPSFNWSLKKSDGQETAYEKSIHKAYLQAIAHAEKFIYIETQYLIGGPVTEKKVVNRIPEAIVERIITKIEQGQPFHTYILLPMFPEGTPTDVVKVIPIRYYQGKTVNWMITQLETALAGKNKNWQDYLSFYFLGQRSGSVDYDPQFVKSRQSRVQQSNRYMIYVHSKMMIVDDKWVFIGTANLNERSMAGNRDTEIGVGMWPGEGCEAGCSQQLKEFRLKLWGEHVAPNWDNVLDGPPESTAVVRKMQELARDNVRLFYDSDYSPMTAVKEMGHLMMWPHHCGLKDNEEYPYIPDYEVTEIPLDINSVDVRDEVNSAWQWEQNGGTPLWGLGRFNQYL